MTGSTVRVAGIAVLAFGLAACGVPQEEFDAVVSERDSLSEEIGRLAGEHEKTLEKLLLDLGEQTKRATEAAEAAAAAREAADQATSELDALRKEFEEYRQQYRIGHREAAKGTRLDSLTTLDGREFVSVTIRQVNPAGMEIFHDAGAAFVAFERLPDPLREEFGYDPEEAASFIHQEKAEEVEYARHLAAIEAEAEKRKAEREAHLKEVGNVPVELVDEQRGRIGSQLESVASEIAVVKKEIERLEYLDWRAEIYGRSAGWKEKIENKQEELRKLEEKSLALRRSLDDLRR